MTAPSNSKTETVTLRLEDQISAGAASAEAAILRLEQAMAGAEGAEKNLDAAIRTNSIARMEAGLERDKRALIGLQEELQRAKRELAGLAAGDQVVNLAEYRGAEKGVRGLVDKIIAQQARVVVGQERLAKARLPEAKGGDGGLKKLESAAQAAGGGVRDLTARTAQFLGKLAALGPEALVAAAALAAMAATAALVSAGIAALSAVLVKAITSADEYRDKVLGLADAGVTLWNSQRASEYQARQLSAVIDQVSGHVAIARDEVAGYAREIKSSLFFGQAMFSAKETTAVLETMSKVAAGGSKALAGQYLEQARTAKLLGLSLDALNKRMDLKFGAVANAKLLSLGAQFSKLGETVRWIFSGADVEPFLKGLQSALSLFDKNSAAAGDLRSAVTRLTEFAIGKFLDLEIVLLEIYLWLLKHKDAFDLLKRVGVAAIVSIMDAFADLLTAIPVLGPALGLVSAGIHAAAAKLGASLTEGMAQGITDSAPTVADAAVGALGKAPIEATKDRLEIRSPSRVAREELGQPVGEGMALGIEDTMPMARRAALVEIAPAEVPSARSIVTMAPANDAAPTGKPGARRDGHSVAFTNCTFGENSEAALRKYILAILEGETLDATAEPA